MGGRHLTDDDELVERVYAMRASGATYVQIKDELHIGASTISRILGVYGKGRARPRVTDGSRERARALRHDGRSVPEIARELNIGRSTAWLITKDIAWTPGPDGASRRAEAGRAYWRVRNRQADRVSQREKFNWALRAGELTDRELMLVGAAVYWAEGSKSKPWRRDESLTFINSDPLMISLYLRWLELLGVDRSRWTFRLHIHETADVDAALQYWSEVVGVSEAEFGGTTLKRHKPETNRHNRGETYRGCLSIYVKRSAAEYRAAEGLWVGMALSAERRTWPIQRKSREAIT